MKAELLAASEGRVLEVVTAGTPSNRALVFHHGGFGCAQGMAPLFRAGAKTGIFLIENQGHIAITYDNADEMIAKALSYLDL